MMILIATINQNINAQSKEYTGESITFINENGGTTSGWIMGKYFIKKDGAAYGYYISEVPKAIKTTAFDEKKYNKNENNKAVQLQNFGGKLFDNQDKEIGKFRISGAQGEFTFYEPYKVLYIKGRNGKKMAEQLIDEGYLKP